MGREAYREGAADAQQFGVPDRERYALSLYDPAYEEGFDDYMKEHPMCACGEEAQKDTKPPMCTDCMVSKGGGNDPSTTDPEMAAMEARDCNEKEGNE